MENASRQNPVRRWLKRIGVAGFLFFLIKGLLWLLVPFFVGYSLWQ
jgi:hypothetical protein